MERRAEFLIAYAEVHGPVSVRGLYYQAEVHGVPGIDKDEHSYGKVQRQVLALRRQGRLAYSTIADATRWMRKPATYDDIAEALSDTARLYRKALWRDAEQYIEVWAEKDAIAGVIYPVTALNDVPLMIARGYASETFCFEAVEARRGDTRPYHVYYLGDFDRSGWDAASSLREKLERFARSYGIQVVFESLAVTEAQIRALKLPIREPKRKSAADKKWQFDYACEVDAIAPDELRNLVRAAIEQHLPVDQFRVLKAAEASERVLLRQIANTLGGTR